MKIKKYSIILIVSILSLAILAFFYFNPVFVTVPDCENAEVVFIYNEDNIRQTVSAEDTEKLKTILGGFRWLDYDMPACGFDDNICIRLGNKSFSPACDRDPIIKFRNKYFSLTEKEIEQIHIIMEKYGAHFPCV